MTRVKKQNPRVRGAAQAAAKVSWLALVAATTLGVGALYRVRAAVTADARKLVVSPEGYRLIVQSYASDSLGASRLPSVRARPLGSTQRAVTPEELARGIAIDVVGVNEQAADAPIVIAWVERGRANLEFDALEARPSADAFYGVASVSSKAEISAARVVLSQRRSS